MDVFLVYTSVAKVAEAEFLATTSVEMRFAACVQLFPQARSFYHWEGKVCDQAEQLLIFKTNSEKLDALIEFITKNHSYDTPEIVAVAADKVGEKYAVWLNSEL